MSAGSSTAYNLSFTAASLRPELARIIAEYFLDSGDWNVAKARVLTDNALQARSPSSGVRMERELRKRLQTLTHDQIALIVSSTAEDRSAIAWLAMLKYNPLAFDFAAEVLREKLAAQDAVLRPSDYETFVDLRSVAHPELLGLTETTRAKVRRVLLRMLKEAGLLAPGTALGSIQRPLLSPACLQAIQADHPRWLAGFLVPDAEIARA